MKINIELLKEMIDKGYVIVQKHPLYNLYIYNYTQFAQYEKVWNEITIMCRGLILDENYNIIARPFKKFFNIEEHSTNEIPNLPFEVFMKMDGSLGILYFYKGNPYIASRGSFNSEQANFATNLLCSKYSNSFKDLEEDKTYLFEIIYPENRIVVDYKGLEDIILLAIINNETGEDIDFPHLDNYLGFKTVKKYNGVKDISKIRELGNDNEEGFVVKFSNNFRVKIKLAEYIRLHRLMTQISNVDIWEHLRNGNMMNEVLDRVPDEFFDWVKSIENDLLRQYNDIVEECNNNFKVLPTRKETAEYFKSQKYPAVLFNMLDGKKYDEIIWKTIRPKFQKPKYKQINEEYEKT